MEGEDIIIIITLEDGSYYEIMRNIYDVRFDDFIPAGF